MMETKMAEEFTASLSNEMAKLEDLDAEFRFTFLETMVPAELEKITNFIQNINTGVGLKGQGPNPSEVGSDAAKLNNTEEYFNSLNAYISSSECIQNYNDILNDIDIGPNFASQLTTPSSSAPPTTASSSSTPFIF